MADTKRPIASASVFFSNTSKGTVTNEAGEFVLDNIPNGRYDMVVSCISYETQVQNIQAEKIATSIVIELKPKAAELKEVVVGGYVKEGWEQWGKFFLDRFIGTSPYAEDCKIVNPQAIQFRNYKKQRILKAFGDETLEIENKALGYKLHYQLELFQYDFTTQILTYQGYPLFEEMETKREARQKRWAKKRQEVYYGSQLHFMRSLYRNKLAEQGFEVRKLVRDTNLEKQRVKALYAKQFAGNRVLGDKNITIGWGNISGNKDSIAYYETVMRQKDVKETVYPTLLTGDSIAYQVDSVTAGCDFTDYLRITYTKTKEPVEYLQQTMQSRDPMNPVSLLVLINKMPIQLISNGFYYEPLDLLNSGYWSWSEKIATMLPYDYWPHKQ